MMVNMTALPAKTFYLGSSNINVHTHISPSIKNNKKNKISRVQQPHQHICRAELVPITSAAVFEFAPATSAVYGALLLGGGVFAYTRSGSKGSLIGGASGGALMAVVSDLLDQQQPQRVGRCKGSLDLELQSSHC